MATDPNVAFDKKKTLTLKDLRPANTPAWMDASRLGSSAAAANQFGPDAVVSQAGGAGLSAVNSPVIAAQDAAAARVAAAQAKAAAPDTAPAAPEMVGGGRPPPLQRLTNGALRYRMQPGNEATVYAGKGAYGEPVFTDQANDPLVKSGLTRRDFDVSGNKAAGDAAFANTQQVNANYAYGQNSLQRGGYNIGGGQMLDPQQGLSRAIMSANDPQQVQSYQDALAKSTYHDPETEAADRILANKLQAKQFGLRQQQADAPASPLSARDQIALASLHERTAVDRAKLGQGQTALDRQDAAEQRQSARDFINTLGKITDPNERVRKLMSTVPTDPKSLKAWAHSPLGEAVTPEIQALLQSVGGGPGTGAGLDQLDFSAGKPNDFVINRPNSVRPNVWAGGAIFGLPSSAQELRSSANVSKLHALSDYFKQNKADAEKKK